MHKEAVLNAHTSSTTVSAQLSTQCKQNQTFNQCMLLKLMSIICLASQGIMHACMDVLKISLL